MKIIVKGQSRCSEFRTFHAETEEESQSIRQKLISSNRMRGAPSVFSILVHLLPQQLWRMSVHCHLRGRVWHQPSTFNYELFASINLPVGIVELTIMSGNTLSCSSEMSKILLFGTLEFYDNNKFLDRIAGL